MSAKKLSPRNLCFMSMFVALSVVLSQISIPIGPVPINFTHVSIFVAAGLLGSKYGTISQIVFVLLGAVGVPVFSGFRGGISVILGPTGGFIIGYIVCTLVTASIIKRFGVSMKILFPAMYVGWVTSYIIGTPWYMLATGTSSVVTALTVCVLPFLIGDAVKTVLSAVLINRLNPILYNKFGNII